MSTLDLTGDDHLQRQPGSLETHTYIGRFWANTDHHYMELRVLATETSPDTWVISAYPGELVTDVTDLAAATHSFFGNHTYTVTGALATALDSAGYEVA